MSNVLIIEDNPMEQYRLKLALTEYGFDQIQTTSCLDEFRSILHQDPPSLIIADIYLSGTSTIFDVLDDIKEQAIPTIFITASTDHTLYTRLDNSLPYGFLVKPFDKLTLWSTIRLVSQRSPSQTAPTRNYLFVRQSRNQKKVLFDDILWLEAAGNYTIVVTATEKMALKRSLRRVIAELDDHFVRVHKKFCVNIQKISHLGADLVIINHQEIPVSFTCKKTLLKRLNILDSSMDENTPN